MGWYDMLVDGSGEEYLKNKEETEKADEAGKGFRVTCLKCSTEVDMIDYKDQWHSSVRLNGTLNGGVALVCKCGNKVL